MIIILNSTFPQTLLAQIKQTEQQKKTKNSLPFFFLQRKEYWQDKLQNYAQLAQTHAQPSTSLPGSREILMQFYDRLQTNTISFISCPQRREFHFICMKIWAGIFVVTVYGRFVDQTPKDVSVATWNIVDLRLCSDWNLAHSSSCTCSGCLFVLVKPVLVGTAVL